MLKIEFNSLHLRPPVAYTSICLTITFLTCNKQKNIDYYGNISSNRLKIYVVAFIKE